MNTDIFSIEQFKPGDTVWLCNAGFTNTGRFKFRFTPAQVTVTTVVSDRIKLLIPNHHYYLPEVYILRDFDQDHWFSRGGELIGSYAFLSDLKLHIAFTEEESKRKYNELLQYEIQKRYLSYKVFETRLQKHFL